MVADEISKLADETAGSLKDITSLVKVNKDEIERGLGSVGSTNAVIVKIIDGIAVVNDMMSEITGNMNKQLSINRSVDGKVDGVMKRTEEMRNSVSEHRAAVAEISKSAAEINALSQSNAGGSEEVSAQADELQNTAQLLSDKVRIFKV